MPGERLGADVGEQLERVKACAWCEALGLSPDARTIDIRRAYLALTKRYHPDNFFRRSTPSFTAALEDVYERLTEAYDTLASSEKRAAYDSMIGVSSAHEPPKAAAPEANPMQIQQAMFLVMDARKAIRAGNPTEAIQMLRSARSFDPSNDDARSLLEKLLKGGTR